MRGNNGMTRTDIISLARKQRHLALLGKVKEGRALSAKELAELEELEAASRPKPAPKKKAAKKEPRRRRLDRKFRPHLEQVAAIFVACSSNALQASEQVRERIPELPRFSDRTFARWADNAEWQVEVEAARKNEEFEKELAAAKRSKNFIRWATERVIELTSEHAQAREDKKKSEITTLEGRILKLNDAIRTEEKHLAGIERKVLDGTDGLSVTVHFEGRADQTEAAK